MHDRKKNSKTKSKIYNAHVPKAKNTGLIIACCISGSFLLLLLWCGYYRYLPYGVLFFYLTLSFISILLYAGDKSAAKKSQWRTPEATLHQVSLIGGWPGALIAQYALRHKNKKSRFQRVFYFCVLINMSVLTYFIYPNEKPWLAQLYLAAKQTITTIKQDVQTPKAVIEWTDPHKQSVQTPKAVIEWSDPHKKNTTK